MTTSASTTLLSSQDACDLRRDRPARILLVDDDEDYAHFLRRLLQRTEAPHRVDTVHDEASARSALDRTPYDLVLTDYDLKHGGSGLAVVEHARTRRPGTRRIVVTSAPERLHGHAGLVESVWNKSWEPATIRDKLASLLRPLP